MQERCSICFGFTDQLFPPGTHVCQIYSTDEERQKSVNKFLLAGLHNNECSSYYSEKANIKALEEVLASENISFAEVIESRTLSLSGTRDAYFPQGRFDPEKMLGQLRQYHLDAQSGGFANARVIGEMSPEIETVEGGERLLEYESKITLLLREHPITAVCQYAADEFSGALIMDILKVHPYMIVRGAIVHNPFFIPPEEFLAPHIH